MGLIDRFNRADWKIICINVNDPLTAKMNDITDVEILMPGSLDSTRDWFKVYKMPKGKPANKFACDGKFYDRKFALDIIEHHFKCWENLVNGGYGYDEEKEGIYTVKSTKGICMVNTTSALKLSKEATDAMVKADSADFVAEPAAIDRLPIDTVHYVDRSKL